MAEKLVSPGVFTRENDLSFIAQGVGEIGAAIVGPFKQGPAFKPTIITTQSELTDVFGAADGTYYTELTAQTEKELLDNIQKEYGDGNLDLNTGEFTPNVTE